VRRLLRNIALWAFHLLFARPVLRWVVGLRYRRRGLTPKGPCLVVANHNSHLDAAILMGLFPLRRLPDVHPVAAADYFGQNWLLRTMAMLFMNGVPIERRPAPGTDALAPIVERLRNGESLVFFPEGSRGEAGVVAPFRPGVGRLVRQLPGLLVLPVFLSGPERIWARGQKVPVPNNIDAIVGKPRSYSPDQDARDIADQVRHDVLALAPPPPPLPGPPPTPPLRVAICGVDTHESERVFTAVVEKLGPLGNTVGVGSGDEVIEAEGAGVRAVSSPVPRAPGRAWLGPLAWLFRTSGRFEGQRFTRMIDRAQVDEALSRSPDARHVVTLGNAIVDLIAWAESELYRGEFEEGELNHLMQYLGGRKRIPTGQWWRFVRHAPEVWLINVFQLAQPPAPDLLVLLAGPAERYLQSVRSRGEQLLPFENESDLNRLQEAYRLVGGVLARRRRVRVLEFDPYDDDPDRVAGAVAATCAALDAGAPTSEVER
jgi:1-acyl-sn-glycerol-3-phosphate acyltransferase